MEVVKRVVAATGAEWSRASWLVQELRRTKGITEAGLAELVARLKGERPRKGRRGLANPARSRHSQR